jgi:TolA-binding protein
VQWIEAHPDDPRAPEALSLTVRAGHYGCGGDDETDRWVKRAFQLLHSRYPKTEAARRTRYWFSASKR